MENLSGSSILAVAGIWSIVFIGYYVWYLWSLSRLFPKIGLPSWAGWVPLWNQWQLIQRGGLPGWLVLLGLIPFLGVVVLVVMIIAINRINTEHGKGAGFTVLGIVLPPLWAMLLTNHIGDSAYARPSAGPAQPVASGIPGFGPPADPHGGSWQGIPPVPPQVLQQPPVSQQQQPVQQQPVPTYAQPQQPAAPQQPAQPQQPVQPHFAPPGQPQPVQPQHLPQAPAPHAAQPPLTPQQQLWAEPSRAQPAAQQAPAQQTPPAAQQTPAAPAPAQPVPPAPVPPAPGETFGFSSTTEGAFERLAAEEAQRSGGTPLGAAQAQRQFSWPSADPTENEEIEARSPLVLPAPPQGAAPAVHPAPSQPAPSQQDPVIRDEAPPVLHSPAPAPAHWPVTPPAAPVDASTADPAQAPPAPRAAEPAPSDPQPVSATPAVPADDDAPSIFDTGSSRRAQGGQSAPVPERTATATGAAGAAAGAGAGALGAAAAAAAASGAVADQTPDASAASPDHGASAQDEELDRTVVVVRRARWGLELPDGEVLELLADDVVLGRKPEAPEGATVLQIVDPTRTMSKTHARLRREGETWTIEDLQSTNGVAIIDQAGQASQIEAGFAVPATERLVIGTLEVKLQQIV